jgi:hypothetical protein
MARYNSPDEKLQRIREIMAKTDAFYHLRERNDQGYVDLESGEGRELLEELETLVND